MSQSRCKKYLVCWKHTTDEWIRRADNEKELHDLMNTIRLRYGTRIQGTVKIYKFVEAINRNFNNMDKLVFLNRVGKIEC